MDHSHLSQHTALRTPATLLNQSIPSSPASAAPITPSEGTPKPRLVNVRQQVAAASAQPASSQAPEFEQVQVGYEMLCTKISFLFSFFYIGYYDFYVHAVGHFIHVLSH